MLFSSLREFAKRKRANSWQSKDKFALNSWILRYAQYDKIYDTKSVWYDKIYKYDRQVSMTNLGLCLNFCDKICLNFIVDCHANFCKICSQ